MKKMRFFSLLLCAVLLLSACKSTEPEAEIKDQPVRHTTALALLDGKLLVDNSYMVFYREADQIGQTLQPLHFDSLCQHIGAECAANLQALEFLPIYNDAGHLCLYYAKKVLKESDMYTPGGYAIPYSTSRIFCYDVVDCTTKEIGGYGENQIHGFWVYQDRLYFTTSDGDNDYGIHSITLSGDNPIDLEAPAAEYNIRGVEETGIYFDDSAGGAYVASLDLTEYKKIYQTDDTNYYEYDNGWFYFAGDYTPYAEDGEGEINGYPTDCGTVNCYRVKADGTAEPEVFLRDLPGHNYRAWCNMEAKIQNGAIYYTTADQTHLGVFRNDMGEQEDIYLAGGGTLLRTDLTTGETTELIKGKRMNYLLDTLSPILETPTHLYFYADALPEEGETYAYFRALYGYDRQTEELEEIECESPGWKAQ